MRHHNLVFGLKNTLQVIDLIVFSEETKANLPHRLKCHFQAIDFTASSAL